MCEFCFQNYLFRSLHFGIMQHRKQNNTCNGLKQDTHKLSLFICIITFFKSDLKHYFQYFLKGFWSSTYILNRSLIIAQDLFSNTTFEKMNCRSNVVTVTLYVLVNPLFQARLPKPPEKFEFQALFPSPPGKIKIKTITLIYSNLYL